MRHFFMPSRMYFLLRSIRSVSRSTHDVGATASIDREVRRHNAVFEDPTAAVRKVPLSDKAIEDTGYGFRPVSRRGRDILGEVVTEAPAGHEDRLETAGAR